MSDDFDPTADFERSIDECYRAIRERVAAGGPGWGGWPAGVHADVGGQGFTQQSRQRPNSFPPLAAQDCAPPLPTPMRQYAGAGVTMKYPWMPLFWGDFLANTMHLSAQEAGAYLFLIAHAWENDGQIPGDRVRLARIAHVRHDRWKEVWKTLEPFFEPNAVGPVITGTSDHGYHHERVTDELHRLGKISSNRKAAALQKLSKSTTSAEQITPQITPYPTSTSNRESSLNGKGREAPQAKVVLPPVVNYRDPGVDYRSPPRAKSDNVLEPTLLVAAKRSTSKE